MSAIIAYNGYHPCHKVLWINPAANITFSVITHETAGIQTVNRDVGGEDSNHSAIYVIMAILLKSQVRGRTLQAVL